MTQINVNDPNPDPNAPRVVETTPTRSAADSTGHSVAAGINLVTTLVVLAVALVLMYFIYQMVMPMLGR